MEPIVGIAGVAGMVFVAFIIILGILALLMPLFVFQILSAVKRMEKNVYRLDRKMRRVIDLLEEYQQKPIKISVSQKPKQPITKPKPRKVRKEIVKDKSKSEMDWSFIVCKHCKTKNPIRESTCIKCAMPLKDSAKTESI
jgi:ribosomal protein L40E